MNKVIVITGTGKGIGRKLCEYYLGKGDYVAGCSRTGESLPHKNYRHFSLDVSDEKEVVKMIRSVHKEFGKADVLLNNAGIANMNHVLLTPVSAINKVFGTNVAGTFLLSREVAKIMIKNKGGRIVNFSTVGVAMRLEGEAVYMASKAAVEMLTRIFAKELSSYNITVNAVGPTITKTDLVKNVPEEKIKTVLARQAIRECSTAEDIINVIDFFISPESGMVTGQIIYLGGLS